MNEFIAETENGERGAAWNQFTDSKRSEREMLQQADEAFAKWQSSIVREESRYLNL